MLLSAYPVLLSLHFLALIFWGGMMLVTDVRLLGSGSPTAEGLRWPKRLSFIAAAFSGALLLWAKPGENFSNPWFWVKMTLLVLMGLSYWVLRRDVSASGRAKLAGGLSLLLLTGAIWAARGPATVKDIMHSMVDPSAEFLFNSVQLISDELGDREIAPRTDADWEEVRQRVVVLSEVSDLLSAPGQRAARPRDRAESPEVENETAEMQRLIDADPGAFAARARKLGETASAAMRTVEAKDKDALFNVLNEIDRACEGCHVRYWYPKDTRAVQAAREAGIIE